MERFELSLRVVGPLVDPDAVTRATALTPTRSFRRGDPVGRNSPGRKRTHGLWCVCIEEDDPEKFDARLSELVKKIPTGIVQDDPLNETQVDIFVGLFGIRDQSTFNIAPETLKQIGDRGWYLVFDMYN